MWRIKIEYPPGSTPLDPNETEGLIPDYITTQGELNKLEKENILEAAKWAYGKKHKEALTASFAYNLHKRMLGRVWRWAGKQRKSNKNIGVEWSLIAQQLAQLLGNTKYWIDEKTFPWDKIGARFHHGLVAVHVFPNGNGRHARLLTDVLLQTHGQEPFTWGLSSDDATLDVEGKLRKQYISALKAADANDFSKLIKFVRS